MHCFVVVKTTYFALKHRKYEFEQQRNKNNYVYPCKIMK